MIFSPEGRAAKRAGGGMLLAGIVLVALNLRGPVAAVSPVLSEVRAALGLGSTAAGLLTTLPVLCFAAAAPLAAALARRTGVERAVLLGLAGIAAATMLRSADGLAPLFTGTVLLGLGITIGNVLIPVVVKQRFADRVEAVTGIYTAALIAGAAAAAASAAPLAGIAGWRLGLALWALLTVAAALTWTAATRAHAAPAAPAAGPTGPAAAPLAGPAGPVWRHPTAWAVALFFGGQSTIYFAITAWLPTLLIERAGLDRGAAGAGLSVYQVVGLAGTLLVPPLAARLRRQRGLAVGVAAISAVPLVGLLTAPSAWPLWTAIGGLAQGAGIALASTLVVLRSHDPATTRGLSAMAQMVAYSLAAAGPVLVGAVYARTGSWTPPLLALLGVAAAMGLAGTAAGRQVTIDRAPAPAPRAPGARAD
jgi:MFS transporter, CP family, cyanate transporter